MWITIIDSNEHNIKVCEDIRKKDNSFDFKLGSGKILIFSQTRKQAFRRGYWLKFKAGIKKFDVLEAEK